MHKYTNLLFTHNNTFYNNRCKLGQNVARCLVKKTEIMLILSRKFLIHRGREKRHGEALFPPGCAILFDGSCA